MSSFVLICIYFTAAVESTERKAKTGSESGDIGGSDGKVNWWNHFLHVGPNEWQPFSDWSRNSPAGRQNAVATLVTDSTAKEQDRDWFFMYGGIGYHPDNATWLYSIQTNSWQEIMLSLRPKIRAFHTMVTLCDDVVILFGGETEDSRCSNETWLFAIRERKWKPLHPKIKKSIPADGLPILRPRCSHAAVTIEQLNSPCHCKQSMLLYGGNSGSISFSDLWELRCKSYANTSGFEFEWISLKRYETDAPALKRPTAISAFNHRIVYIYGIRMGKKTEMWSYTATNGSWQLVSVHSHPSISVNINGIYVTDRGNIHLFLLCCWQPLVAFDLLQKTWFKPQQEGGTRKMPDISHGAVAGRDDAVMIFGGSGRFFTAKQDMLWQLRMFKRDSWVWFLNRSPKPSPLQERSLAMASGFTSRDSLFVFGGIATASGEPLRFASNGLWNLDMNDMKWSLENSGDDVPMVLGATTTILHDSVLVVFGGCSRVSLRRSFLAYQGTWGYYVIAKKWHEILTERKPPVRFWHSAVAIDSQTLVVFGGGGFTLSPSQGVKGLPRTDVWSLSLPTKASRANAQWSCLSESGPAVAIFHSAVYIDGRLLIYGGATSWEGLSTSQSFTLSITPNYSDSLWEFNIQAKIWRKLDYVGNSPGPLCLHSAVSFRGFMLITGGCAQQAAGVWNVNAYHWQLRCIELAEGVRLFNLETKSWLLLTVTPPPMSQRMLTPAFVWNDWIVLVGGLDNRFLEKKGQTAISFSIYRPACPAGMMNRAVGSLQCIPCDTGFYSERGGSSNCTQCPNGLSTSTNQSKTKSSCNVCIRDHCRHGQCRAVLPGPEVDCTCYPGFTKDDRGICSNPTYILVGLGVLAGFSLLSCVVYITVRLHVIRRKHRKIIRSKEDELLELANVWTIDSRELKMKQRIDTDSPGGFGDVYKADYRDIAVAVKSLKSFQRLERIELEFKREIEVMRTIRHPNVVLFIGGGRHHDDGCPFLVVEFMARGSIRSILKKKDTDIPFSLIIRFAVETARGMRFLHGLRPPRIHRDLKSSNLLVSESWTVKVADFGSARLVKDEATIQDAVRGAAPLSLTEPLLHAEYELSSGVGTPCWSAPEILRGDGYGTAVDVYSFGIVLWEMITRELPYDDRIFRSILDLNAAVLSGVRPTVKESWPRSYVSLMRSCWSGQSSTRPTFSDILTQLEGLQDTLFARRRETEAVDA